MGAVSSFLMASPAAPFQSDSPITTTISYANPVARVSVGPELHADNIMVISKNKEYTVLFIPVFSYLVLIRNKDKINP